jgi:hypothetical protein
MSAKAIATLLLLGLIAFFSAPLAAAQDDVAVVVNSGNTVSNLSLSDLRKIFSGDKHSWPGGSPIKLVVRGPGCPERLALLKLLGMAESDYKQYWVGRVFRGESDEEPLMVPSIGMQMEALKVFSGAISLATARDVKAGMKVIKVDNLSPGSPGYPLH